MTASIAPVCMRYAAALSVWFLIILAALTAASTDSYTTTIPDKSTATPNFIQELYTSNLTSTLTNDWDKDYAVMFYAPWCKYCKQLLPSWEAIASLSRTNNNLVIGKLNCESPSENVKLCKDVLEVDRYPSIMFFGYGDFKQIDTKKRRNHYPMLVRFVADLYPEALYDWIIMLSGISTAHRRWDDVIGFFTGKSRLNKKIEKLQQRLENTEKRAALYGAELERYKAIEVFDTLEDYGDPFPLLNDMSPDQQNLPFRVCVADMASEFCKYYKDSEAYCGLLPKCVSADMEPDACRPKVCPFEDKRGCVVTSTCLDKSVVEQYKQALAGQSA